MKHFFGYIRISDAKQEQGVSLVEQRDAITRYALKTNLELVRWFEERQTAAKRGRPIFNQMVRLLRKGKVDGVVIHKIDRSARNLRDWADIGELLDMGYDIHVAHDGLDLHSRGGRLAADVQAVVAADFIRNLREETRKGFYGRLKQGLYPLPAPLGYLNCGRGKPKVIDPIKGPLVKKAFDLYSTGRYSLASLVVELQRLGLRNRNGGKVSLPGLSKTLNNPFYIGIIRLRRSGETFAGVHKPLVKKSVFDRVQQTLSGKIRSSGYIHNHLFRRTFRCWNCNYCLIGEIQKGNTYYRCHTRGCPTTGVREDTMTNEVQKMLLPLQFSKKERRYLVTKIPKLREEWIENTKKETESLRLRIGQTKDRLNRLTDAYLDEVIDKDVFEHRKTALLHEQAQQQETLADLEATGHSRADRLAKFLELAGSAWFSYKKASYEEKRDLLEKVTSNRLVDRKNVVLELKETYREVANRQENLNGDPYRCVPRTFDDSAPLSDVMKQAWDTLLEKLVKWFANHPVCSCGACPECSRTLDTTKTEKLAA